MESFDDISVFVLIDGRLMIALSDSSAFAVALLLFLLSKAGVVRES